MIDKLTADKIRKFYPSNKQTFDYSTLSLVDKEDVEFLYYQGFINVLSKNDFGTSWEIKEFELSPKGREQLEEYDRENQHIELDTESNAIAKSALEEAQRANRKSRFSNIIAGCALAAAIVSIVIEIIFRCL